MPCTEEFCILFILVIITLPHKNTTISVNNNCLRFSFFQGSPSGFGHRFTEFIFGLNLADETESTFIYNDEMWSKSGIHGSYHWFEEVFQLSKTYLSLSKFNTLPISSTVKKIEGMWDLVVNKSKTELCNVLFTTRSRFCIDPENPNKASSCFRFKIDAYENVKWRLRYLGAQVMINNRLSKPYKEKSLSIAWHVRTGDISLHQNITYFSVIAKQLVKILKEDQSYRIYFIGENIFKEHNFDFLKTVCSVVFSNRCEFPILDSKNSLAYMMWSDVLITSGSSFSFAAAILRTNGIVLSGPIRGSSSEGCYQTSDYGFILNTGEIIKPKLKELKAIFSSIILV